MHSPKLTPAHLAVMQLEWNRGAMRKAEILEATLDCLAKEGIERTTFEAIGKRLGIRKSHVAYHFPSLDDLVEKAMRFVAANAQAITVEKVRAGSTWQEQIRGVVDGAFEWAEKFPRETSVLLLFYYRCSYHDRFRTLNTELREMGVSRILGVLKPRLAEKKMSRGASRQLAKTIQYLIFGALVDAYTTKGREKPSRARAWVNESVAAMLE